MSGDVENAFIPYHYIRLQRGNVRLAVDNVNVSRHDENDSLYRGQVHVTLQ